MSLRAVIWCAVSTTIQADEDKESLPAQERDARALCEQSGWDVVATLLVPGHSRYYKDIHECARDMRAKGIDALDRLIDLYTARAFDVLICRDATRFARRPSLHARIVEEIIDAGARIYSFADGWVDDSNADMFIALGGYASKAHIKQLVKGRKIAMKARARRGLPTGSSVPMSHLLLRDERGRAAALVVNEEVRPLLEDVAKLVLAGVAWTHLETELYARFGRTSPATGQPYYPGSFYKLIYNPIFWGNSAQFHRNIHGGWAYDPAIPPPRPESVIHYGTHSPFFTGELAARLQSELRRRETIVLGKRRGETHRFSGLLMCDECHRHLPIRNNRLTRNGRSVTYQCHCTQRRHVKASHVQEYLGLLLPRLISHPDSAGSLFSPASTDQGRLTRLEAAAASAEKKVRRLVDAQASADDTLAPIYAEKARAAAQDLAALRTEIRRLSLSPDPATIHQERARALTELATLGLAAFWARPDTEINLALHRIFGPYRLFCRDGTIIRIARAPTNTLHRSKFGRRA